MDYRITWTIDLDAPSPVEAALRALAIQRDPDSLALHFHVHDPRGEVFSVDLSHPDEPLTAARESITLYVTVETFQGNLEEVRAHAMAWSARLAEKAWLQKTGIHDAAGREAKAAEGTGFTIAECALLP